MDERWNRLAELAVARRERAAGAGPDGRRRARPGRAGARGRRAAYERGAKFVDVVYFDPTLKRARIEHADPETLEYVPDVVRRAAAYARRADEARGSRSPGSTAPGLLDGLDQRSPARTGCRA